MSVALAVVGIIDVIIALLVILRDPRRLSNRSFALFAFSMGGWIFGITAFLLTTDSQLAVVWAKIYYTFPLLIALSGVYFALSFPSKQAVSHVVAKAAWIGFLLIEIPLLFVNNFMIQGLEKHDWGKLILLAPLPYLLYSLYIVFFYSFILYRMLQVSKSQEGFKSQHARLFFIGLTISGTLGIVFNLLLPLLGNYKLIHLGPLFNSFAVFFLAYAIARHKMFDIRLVVARSLAYIFTLAVIGGMFGFVVFGLSGVFFDQHFSLLFQILVSVMTAIVALGFVRVKRFFDKVSNRLFYQDAYDTQEFIDLLNRVLVSSTDVDSLLHKTCELIDARMKSRFCYFSLRETSYVSERNIGEGSYILDPSDRELLSSHVQKLHARVTSADDIADSNPELYKVMRKYNIDVIARLVTTLKYDVGGVGYLAFGDKRSGNPYSKQDINVIRIIANELVIAIENALRFEEIENFNVTLQEKVDDATKRLKKANSKLKQMDETKDEFISMASHQLRTPLTSVKGYLSMVLEGDAGELNDMQKKLLDQAFTSSQRMVFLIADLLNLSRLRTGKFIIEANPTNLADVVEGELQQLQETAAGRNLKLVFEKPKEFPSLMLDETKIRQVIMNFVDNAIYYTPSGGTIEIKLKQTAGSVEFTVKDDGIGVPKTVQHHLFNKFYRADNARKARPDGTGLGLFMAKKVVVAQGGAIIFQSTEGRGSTFGFTFSKEKLKIPSIAKPISGKKEPISADA